MRRRVGFTLIEMIVATLVAARSQAFPSHE